MKKAINVEFEAGQYWGEVDGKFIELFLRSEDQTYEEMEAEGYREVETDLYTDEELWMDVTPANVRAWQQ